MISYSMTCKLFKDDKPKNDVVAYESILELFNSFIPYLLSKTSLEEGLLEIYSNFEFKVSLESNIIHNSLMVRVEIDEKYEPLIKEYKDKWLSTRKG